MTRLETTAYKPNGLAISPDGKLLYVADNGEKRWVLLALALDENGDVSQPRVIHNFGANRGIDGMTVTTGGRIVAAAGPRLGSSPPRETFWPSSRHPNRRRTSSSAARTARRFTLWPARASTASGPP